MTEDDLYDLLSTLADGRVYPYVVPLGSDGLPAVSTPYVIFSIPTDGKRAARTVLTGMCYSVGSATRQGSSSLTRFIGQSAITSSTWRR